ncbi:MAG: hypothetical protein AAF942_10575 [Pseudomonadota bacterium]
MGSGDPVPAIAEADATGEIADLYADIRKTLGVPLVNLIWRNLAVTPGALGWAWSSVRPLYGTGRLQAEARALRDMLVVPDLPSLPVEALRSAGVDETGERTIQTILESYHRSNPLNLVALSTLLAALRGDPVPDGKPAPSLTPEPPIDGTLPALLALAEMEEDTAALVVGVNRLGTRGDDHILVSMPRHLAHWPGYLGLYWALVAPLDADGQLDASVDAVLDDGKARGGVLAAEAGIADGPPADAAVALEATLDDFCRNAISRMIPVVALLRKAMPSGR